jgi:hypothetical protein
VSADTMSPPCTQHLCPLPLVPWIALGQSCYSE